MFIDARGITDNLTEVIPEEYAKEENIIPQNLEEDRKLLDDYDKEVMNLRKNSSSETESTMIPAS